jgi:hypothetical protein
MRHFLEIGQDARIVLDRLGQVVCIAHPGEPGLLFIGGEQGQVIDPRLVDPRDVFLHAGSEPGVFHELRPRLCRRPEDEPIGPEGLAIEEHAAPSPNEALGAALAGRAFAAPSAPQDQPLETSAVIELAALA